MDILKKVQQDDAVFAIVAQRKDLTSMLYRFYKNGATLTPLQVRVLDVLFNNRFVRNWDIWAPKIKTIYWSQESFDILKRLLGKKALFALYVRTESVEMFTPDLEDDDIIELLQTKQWELVSKFVNAPYWASMLCRNYSKEQVLGYLPSLCVALDNLVNDGNYYDYQQAIHIVLQYIYDSSNRNNATEQARGKKALEIITPHLNAAIPNTGIRKLWRHADDLLAWAGCGA